MLEVAPDLIERAVAERLAIPPPDGFASLQHLDFFASRHPELVASGWMGAGKSRVLCQKAWKIARRYPGVTVALFRKAQNSIAATTERTFERDVVDRHYLAPGHQGRNKTEHWWGLANGSRIYFLGLDPDPITGVPSKVGSLDLGWAGVDEAVELSEEDWIMLLGRLRDPRMDWHQLAAATNPGPPKHWLRTRMMEDPERRLMLHIKANKFLAPDYLAMLQNLPDTAAGRRLGKGEWSAAEGVIWIVPEEQIRSPETGAFKRVKAGVDWGFVHAFACEVIGQSGSGRLSVVREVYAKGALLRDIIPVLEGIQKDYPGITFYADPSEPAYITECRQAGLKMVAANNDVDAGLQSVAVAINDGMLIDPSCQGLLGEIPGYTWAPNKAGGFHEKPIEVNDDACDALRYGVMAFTSSGSWAGLAGRQVTA